MNEILHPILVAIAGLLASAISAWLIAQAKAHGFELSQSQKDALDQEAKAAILYAEELAASGAIKQAEKLPAALAFIARRNPKIEPREAHDAIHAMLPAMNAGATEGAAQDLYDPTKSTPR